MTLLAHGQRCASGSAVPIWKLRGAVVQWKRSANLRMPSVVLEIAPRTWPGAGRIPWRSRSPQGTRQPAWTRAPRRSCLQGCPSSELSRLPPDPKTLTLNGSLQQPPCTGRWWAAGSVGQGRGKCALPETRCKRRSMCGAASRAPGIMKDIQQPGLISAIYFTHDEPLAWKLPHSLQLGAGSAPWTGFRASARVCQL